MRTLENGTVYLPLPQSMQKPIEGGCQCAYCRAHPHKVPMWDALAGHPDQQYTWPVHYPELPR